jgi:tetratricopeptide (TPR) repeat protein
MAVGRYGAALHLFEEAQRQRSSRNPLDERLLNEALVNALFKLQRYEAAGSIITDPEKPLYPSRASDVALVCYHMERQDYPLALQGLSDLPTDSLPIRLIAVQIQLLMGNIARVRTDLNALQHAYPGSDNVSLHVALAALLDNDLDAAEASLSPLQTDRGIPTPLSLVFMILRLAQGEITAARSALATGPMPLYEWSALNTIENHLQNRELAIPLAYTHFSLAEGFPRQAEEAIETAHLADPNNIFVQWLRAETQSRLGNHLQAAIILEQAETQLPMSQTLRFLRARALEKAGDIPAAKALYAEILTLRPDFVDAALAYGRIWEREANPNACLPIYAATLNYLPNSLPLLKAYAWALLNTRDFAGFQPIFKHLESHTQMRPAALLHLQGWCSHQQGDFPKAVQQLQEALEHAPGDPEICYHLGMAQWANGHPDTAHQLLTYAMYFDKTREKHGSQVARIMAPDRRSF